MRNNHRSPPLRMFALPALLLSSAFVAAEPARYEIDRAHVVVAFLVDHLGLARVLGTFGEVEGSYLFDEEAGEVRDISISVATGSVSTDDAARDEHLRSDDFLDSGAHPEMSFVATGARRTGDRTFEVDGELTLLGVTRPLMLEATWNGSGDYPIGRNVYAMGVSARAALDRSDFGMTYAVDNGWVGDEVSIIIEFEARRQ